MAHIIGDLMHYFHLDEVNIDNWHFKYYYKAGTILFFAGSMVGVLNQYFGDPIECDFTTISADVAADYCWIHGSSYIPQEYQHHMKCIADLEGVHSEDQAPDTSYYQWVVFFMLLQAGTFYAPYKIWSYYEGGLMESFVKEAKAAIILHRDDGVEGAEVMETMVEKYVRYFRSIYHHNNWYVAKFFFCEALNVFVLMINFILTDEFLQGRFWYYGIDVIKYLRMSRGERQFVNNPMCATFPTEVSCTVPNIGAAGLEQHHNGMCVLSQNILNEKIYIIVWWYFALGLILASYFVLYRIATIFFIPFRYLLFMALVGNSDDQDLKKSVRYVLSKGYLGDWFVLYQLGRNVNTYFMRQFMKELKRDLGLKPNKRFLSSKGDGSNSTASTMQRSHKYPASDESLLLATVNGETTLEEYSTDEEDPSPIITAGSIGPGPGPVSPNARLRSPAKVGGAVALAKVAKDRKHRKPAGGGKDRRQPLHHMPSIHKPSLLDTYQAERPPIGLQHQRSTKDRHRARTSAQAAATSSKPGTAKATSGQSFLKKSPGDKIKTGKPSSK